MATPLNPEELGRALAAYRASGTFAAAARAIGRDETGVRRALRRHLAPERAELFAEELDTAHANALRAVNKARRRASTELDHATDPRDVALLAHVTAEALRAVTTARTAHARLTAPSHAPATRVAVVAAMTDDELNAELDKHIVADLRTRLEHMHGRIVADAPTDPAELERQVLRAVTILVGRAVQGDADAHAALAVLLTAATDTPDAPSDTTVIELPRSLARPRET